MSFIDSLPADTFKNANKLTIFYILLALAIAPLLFYIPKNGEIYKATSYTNNYFIFPIIFLSIIRAFYSYYTQKKWNVAEIICATLLIGVTLKTQPLMFINSHIGTQTPILVEGTIIDKNTTKRKSKSKYTLSIRPKTGIKTIRLRVNWGIYMDANIGGNYSENWKKGSLGFLYR